MHPKLHTVCLVSTALLLSALTVSGKGKHAKNPANASQDEINVIAHIPLTGGSVNRFLTTRHYRRDYLYVEHEANRNVTLIDVTALDRPTVLADIQYPSGSNDKLVAVAGNAALVSGDMDTTAASIPQNFRIMGFADPAHPVVKQEFSGVTALARDDQRGLIFLANAEGVWILQQHYAADPAAEKEWEHMMLDAR